MKKPFPLPVFILFLCSTVFLFGSCKKVNEATFLGGGLVPEVDNINTFETVLATETDNLLLTDTTKLVYSDPVVLGTIANDPELGQTNAALFFQIAPTAYRYPFTSKEALTIDSVVLSLSFIGGYGDTLTPQTVRVFEIAQGTSFNDTTLYGFDQPHFETTGSELGSATYSINTLNDSITLIRKRDTTKVANQLRIRLDDALGYRFAGYDSASVYRNDTLFKEAFRGLALKTDDGSGNGLAYFSLANTSVTALTVYYRATRSGTVDTAETRFIHTQRLIRPLVGSKGGQANSIKRQPGGGWKTYLENGLAQDDKLYIQTSPGSAGHIKIPGLDTLRNKFIHRAELIVSKLPSALENIFTAPDLLFLDRINTAGDTAFTFHADMPISPSQDPSDLYGTIDFRTFGGFPESGGRYRFNITGYVQDIATRQAPNQTLRLYAPGITRLYAEKLRTGGTPIDAKQFINLPTPNYTAKGRVVLGGGTLAEADKRLRLRIIYSKL